MTVNTNLWILGKDVDTYITTEDSTNGITTNSGGAPIAAAGAAFRTQDGEIPELSHTVPSNDCLIDNVIGLEKDLTEHSEELTLDGQDSTVPIRTKKSWSVKITKVMEDDNCTWRKFYEAAGHGIRTGTTLHEGNRNLTVESGYRLYLKEKGRYTTCYQGIITEYDVESDPQGEQHEVITFKGGNWTSTASAFITAGVSSVY